MTGSSDDDDAAGRIADAIAGAIPAPASDPSPPAPLDGEPPAGAESEGDRSIDMSIVEICAREPETDIGNGRRFLAWYGDRVLSINGLGWAAHDGRRWCFDEFAAVIRPLAHRTVEAIRFETAFIGATPDEEKAIAAGEEHRLRWRELVKKGRSRTVEDEAELFELIDILKAAEDAASSSAARKSARGRYAKTSAGSGKMDNMLQEAQCYQARPVNILDRDPYAINVWNGTLRLLRPEDGGPWTYRLDDHRKDDMISKLAPVDFIPEAEAPHFLAFIEAVLPDDEVRTFMQRFFGYCLTALTHEQVFVFLYGMGRNGKSTLVDIVCRILGDYTTTVPFETLAGDDRRKGSEATPDLVRLPGARLVRASEPEAGMKFRESMVKGLTSGEPILIRRMREEFIEVYPTFKLVISGNHKPDIRGGDDGIWRRVLLIPFLVQIPRDQVDRSLPEKLWDERSGILNWLLAGALSYLEDGLKVPDAVRAATEDYRDASDPYGAFLKGGCVITGQDSDSVSPGEFYEAFVRFCRAQGYFPPSQTTFSKAMPDKAAKLGIAKVKSHGLAVYRRIRIRDEFRFDPSHTPPPDDF